MFLMCNADHSQTHFWPKSKSEGDDPWS